MEQPSNSTAPSTYFFDGFLLESPFFFLSSVTVLFRLMDATCVRRQSRRPF